MSPDLFWKATKRFDIGKDKSNPVEWCRASLTYDSIRHSFVPQLIGVHELGKGARVILALDRCLEKSGICIGQKVPLLRIKNRAGLKVARLEPEVRLGLDATNLAAKVSVLLSDDDYSGFAFKPLYHPAVIGAGAALYAAMMRWRFPLPFSIKLGNCGIGGGQSIDFHVLSKLQRTDVNPICTLGVRGAMLTLRV